VPFVDGPDGPVEVLVSGRGEPVTVFAHGLASSIDETRPFGSGVGGTRVFLHFRGHGLTPSPRTPWTYAALESELLSVADAYAASQGLGISLGGGALLRAAWDEPDRFRRLVLVLPAAIDRARHDEAITRMTSMASLVEVGDIGGLVEGLVAEQPVGARARPDVLVWAHRQATRLLSTGAARALRDLPSQHPLPADADLSVITARTLVVGQEGDSAHPAAVARELASRLPFSELVVYDDRGLLWSHRAEVRRLIATFLTP
jgi:pimeloyl-ACP methyl ester carboxylesterase